MKAVSSIFSMIVFVYQLPSSGQILLCFCVANCLSSMHHLRSWCLCFYGCPLFTEQQKTDAQHFPSRQFIQRRPGPPTMVPSKNHVSSPLTNQLASMNALFNSTQSQAILQGHSHSTSSTTASSSSGNSNSATRSSMNEMSAHANIGPGNTNRMP